MTYDTNSAIEDVFTSEIGISIHSSMKILNDAGICTEDMSDISNKCKNILADEIEKRYIPYEFRFLLLNVVLCECSRLLSHSTRN